MLRFAIAVDVEPLLQGQPASSHSDVVCMYLRSKILQGVAIMSRICLVASSQINDLILIMGIVLDIAIQLLASDTAYA